MRSKLKRFVLLGGVIGFWVGLLTFLSLTMLSSWFPGFDLPGDLLLALTEIPGKVAASLTELSIHLICGQSRDIGCVSGLGMLIFFVLWPLSFCIFWALIGAASGLAFAILYRS